MGGSGEQDIENLIQGLDQTLHSGNSWYNTGLFDFAYKDEMEKYIYYFEIQFRNFSSSYAAVEMRVALANRFVTELSSFIKQPYEKTGMCVHKLWGQNHKRSGAKVSYGVSSGVSSDFVKSQLIYEQLQYVKNLFLKEIVKYIPIMQYSGYKSLCGINVFETNLTPYDKLDHSVYTSLGMNDMHGFNFSMAERLYMSTETIKERNGHNTDMMFVYNPERITDFEMYGTAHGKTIEYLTREYMDNLYRVVLLKSIGLRYLYSIGMYRNQINKCKANKSSQKHLLKMKYLLNRDFYDFKKIDEELPVKEELTRANQYLERNQYTKNSKYWHRYTYKSFTGTPDCIWRQIKSNYIEVENDLCRKLEVSSALTNYSTEASNRRLAIIQVILAIMTFVLLIFPGKAIELAEIIKVVWKSIIGLLAVGSVV